MLLFRLYLDYDFCQKYSTLNSQLILEEINYYIKCIVEDLIIIKIFTRNNYYLKLINFLNVKLICSVESFN